MAISSRLQLIAALTHRDFRLFWAGSAMSVSGRQVSMIAVAWLVYDITGSALQLGLLGFVRFGPALVLGLAGGVAADKADRRQLLIATTLGGAAIYGALATLTLTGAVQVWHILAVTVLAASVGAFEGPSRQAIFPHLIDRRHLTNAVALTSAIDPAVRIFMPVIAGLMIDRVGTGYTGAATVLFFVAGMYLAASYLLFRVHTPRVQRALGGGLQNLLDGLRYVRANHIFAFLLLMAFVHAFFGMAYTTLLPVFATNISEESSGLVLGALFSAGGLGGILGALFSGSLRSMPRPGLVMVAASTVFGGALVAFAYVPGFALAAALLMLASMSNNVFGVTAQSILHRRVPDAYRGRVMGFWGMQFTVLHPAGSLQIGALATLLGAPGAIALAGAAVVAFAILVAGSNRRFRELRDEPAAAVELRQTS